MAPSTVTPEPTTGNTGKRIVIDPITRIEGHLRCEVNINEDNVVTNAVSSGTMFRGLEIILQGRDPRDAWAFTERICGVCTGTHALASIRAVENSLDITIPDNANCIRNLMQLSLWYHDHLVHFYQLAGLDWVDVLSAASADPKATSNLAQSLSPWPNSSPGYFASVKEKLVNLVKSGQLGIFKNGYWGHPAYKLSPEANLMVVAHYLEALDFQKDAIRVHAVFGGKNPHPNWLVGGVPTAINLDGAGGDNVINMERLNLVQQLITRCKDFAQQVLMPDTEALGLFYPEWFTLGGGLSKLNVLSYGDFPSIANDHSNASLLVPRGAIIQGNFEEVHAVDLLATHEIQEAVAHSWYTYPEGVHSLHPFEGITEPHYRLGKDAKGTATRIEQLDEQGPYSWIKTPRWKGHTMEVGPLARVLVGYALKHADVVEHMDKLCAKFRVPMSAMHSTLGRLIARSYEAEWSARAMQMFYDKLISNIKNGDTTVVNAQKWDPATWPAKAQGVGFTEAPRGALGHWLKIENTRIKSYQCVVPTTWNAAPRAEDGALSAYEASLLGTPLAKPDQPLEILRTLHSFDPCLACATHLLGPDGSEIIKVQVV